MADIIVNDPYANELIDLNTHELLDAENVTSSLNANLEQLSLMNNKDINYSPAQICADFMNRKCINKDCALLHDKKICFYFWKNSKCKNGDACPKLHTISLRNKAQLTSPHTPQVSEKENLSISLDKHNSDISKSIITTEKSSTRSNTSYKVVEYSRSNQKRIKNTECFDPLSRPVDMRIVYDLGKDRFTTKLTAHDVIIVPNAFSDFAAGDIYDKLSREIRECGIPEERLLKMRHGNDKIEGTHYIADDKTRWKENCPTFGLIIRRLKDFFCMDVKATRFNLYEDTSQWKPFHHDAAAVKREMALSQNFTVAVSFGTTRDAAFEHASTRTVISMPVPDGCIYAFTNDTNIIWRHGILQDTPVRAEGRISVIAWGWIEGMDDEGTS